MAIPGLSALPDWLPWWVPILILVPALFLALAFLFMPFAVFGVKGRLEAIEARLDEIQGEIRSLALRMPEPVHHARYDDTIFEPPAMDAPPPLRADPIAARPPIPPSAPRYRPEPREEEPRRPLDLSRGPRPPRAEPRLDWPR
jgi:hypothetical protein